MHNLSPSFPDELYTYNAASVRSRIDYTSWGTLFADYYKQYSYDSANRLTMEHKRLDSNNSTLYRYGYQYDAAGNRTRMDYADSLGCDSTYYDHNDFNQLTYRNSDSYSPGYSSNYDDNGNLIQTVDEGPISDKEYTHNRENRLIAFDDSDNGIHVDYTYDASGRLLMRYWPGTGKKEKYYYNNINQLMVKEKLSGGVWHTQKVHALKQALIGQIIACRDYTAWSGSTPTAYQDRWYHYDLLGNTTSLTNVSGTVTNQYDMEAFGSTKHGTATGVHITTKSWDAEMQLYYFAARWYSPETSTWNTIEPQGVDGPNLYGFDFQNPIYMFDPNGLQVMGPYGPPTGPASPLSIPIHQLSKWFIKLPGVKPVIHDPTGFYLPNTATPFQTRTYLCNPRNLCATVGGVVGFCAGMWEGKANAPGPHDNDPVPPPLPIDYIQPEQYFDGGGFGGAGASY
jgi:RHS repeat-associated protein